MMSVKKNGVRKTVIISLAIVAIIAGAYCAQVINANKDAAKSRGARDESRSLSYKQINRDLFHGTLLDNPRPINQFSLTGVDNAEFNNSTLLGQWTLVFFGFTNCGYMCPTTMAELGKTYRLLEQKGAKTLPKVVMITLDPERDSIERLSQYVRAFDLHFYGARGNNEAIHSMTKDLGIAYAKIAPKDLGKEKQDDIEHTGAVILFNPEGKLTAFFTNPHSAENIASDFLMLTV
jgi:protein SCO1